MGFGQKREIESKEGKKKNDVGENREIKFCSLSFLFKNPTDSRPSKLSLETLRRKCRLCYNFMKI